MLINVNVVDTIKWSTMNEMVEMLLSLKRLKGWDGQTVENVIMVELSDNDEEMFLA